MERHLIGDIPQKAIIDADGKVLLVCNREGHWQLPGGRLNEGENPREGIIREVKEELGVDTEPTRIFDTFVFQSKSGQWHYVVVYKCKLLSNMEDMKDMAGEAVRMAWVSSVEEAEQLENDGFIMWDGYKQVLDRYFKEKRHGE